MKRYWVPADWVDDEKVTLEGDIFHHIHKVCRNDAGSKFEVLTGGQKAYFVEMTEVEKRRGVARILETREIAPLPRPHIYLAVSLPRFHKFDFIIEKSVELGVAKVLPFFSEFSYLRKPDASFEKKKKRWEKIVQGASQQSGRGDLMPVCSPETLDRLLQEFVAASNAGHATGLFPYEGEADLSIKQELASLRELGPGQFPEVIWVFVGSEGGFSHSEVSKFGQSGLRPLTLGEQVLRVDTACLALVSILKYEFDLLEGK